MNKLLIFVILSTSIFVLSIISICVSPIINHLFDSWAYENCQIYEDLEDESNLLEEKFKNQKLKTLCEREKAMYGLEYSAFIFEIISGFLCLFLSFLQYLNIGKNTEKNIGLIGLVGGSVGFILSFIYFIYSAYIFTNDNVTFEKLFPNGAKFKYDYINSKYITIYEGEKSYLSEYVKFNEFAKKQYNYDSDYYKTFKRELNAAKCTYDRYKSESKPNPMYYANDSTKVCNYIFFEPPLYFIFKYIYDKWITALIFGFIISILNLGLIVFGFLLFKGVDK